jgi:HAMP domain-containing protein
MMPTEGAPSKPFDEQAALEELERLRDAIEASRRKRSQTTDEFEAFVRSFRTPAVPEAPRTDLSPAPKPDVVARAPRQEPRQPVPPIEQPVALEPPVAVEQPQPPVVAESAPASKPRAGALMPRVLAGAAILIVALVLLMRPWRSSSPETSSSPSTGAATTASAPQATTPAPTATPAPAPTATRTHALEGELNIQRRVWVRAIVDGQKTVERELPPGTRVPLQADRAIVIRVGDAGALRMTLNGVDRGPLGKDAEIVTRTFTASK